VARQHQLGVVLSVLRGRRPPGRSWIEDLLARRPSGVITAFSGLTEAHSQQLQAREIPFVLLDPTGEPGRDTPSVGASNWSGGLSATRHLLSLGHRRIATIAGPEPTLASRARLDGYRAAMDMAGAPVDPALVRQGDFRIEGGLQHARELLALPDRPTAIFAGNDGHALGVYQAAAEAGVHIPQDLSVVGFDDLYPAQWTIPPLTTVRQPVMEMAGAAATMAIALARGEDLPQSRVEFATDLVVRGSTAPLHG
jgi:DNA-binding LacI/PurR family transcriptional regulator